MRCVRGWKFGAGCWRCIRDGWLVVMPQPMFFAGMATALAKEDVPGDLRQLAGLLMKSSLDATNDVLREARASRWIAIEQTVRQQIKNMAVAALRSPVEVAAHTAAIVVAAIGGIELRAKQWPELITGLLSSVNKTHLECLGYLCEELVRADACTERGS